MGRDSKDQSKEQPSLPTPKDLFEENQTAGPLGVTGRDEKGIRLDPSRIDPDPREPKLGELDEDKPKTRAPASHAKVPYDAPKGKVWMIANADQQIGFCRGGVRWPHVATGEEEPQLVDEEDVDAVLNEPHLRGAAVVKK
jgi:hypothetical protein